MHSDFTHEITDDNNTTCYIVIDNSTNTLPSNEILEFCWIYHSRIIMTVLAMLHALPW